MCFVQIARPKINAAKPDLKFAEIAKMLGEQWKNMDATTRAGYEKMAEQDKERYQREIAAYVPMSEAGLEELRKAKAAKKSAGGLQKPYKCSAALTKFLGGDKTISRALLTSKMWSYFKEKNLMDPENKRWIIADKPLSDLLGIDRFQGFTVSKYLSPTSSPWTTKWFVPNSTPLCHLGTGNRWAGIVLQGSNGMPQTTKITHVAYITFLHRGENTIAKSASCK